MYNFCTYFDQNYLSRGLALYDSLKANCKTFRLWVLCMDNESHDILLKKKLPELKLISLKDFERQNKDLLKVKTNRSKIEYYFTCTPSLILFVLNNFMDVSLITYLDADLYFFNDPLPLYEEMRSQSIAIVGHRFSHKNQKHAVHGIYNVGWLSFRRDENALTCLNWWRQKCNEWCYDRAKDNRFADQKYLDNWPEQFKNVIVLRNKGANVAIWNAGNYKISINEKIICVDGQPLIFFHFHGIRHLIWRFYDTGAGFYKFKIGDAMRKFVYAPYLKTLIKLNKDLSIQHNKCFHFAGARIKHEAFLPEKIYLKMKDFACMIYRVIVYRSCIAA